MKAIISSTYDDKYLYFIPICVWAWNKLNVDVICFMPEFLQGGTFVTGISDDLYDFHVAMNKLKLINKTIKEQVLRCENIPFYAPEHKEATYAQCSRLYAACLDLPEDEVLVTSDVDMCLFKVPPYSGEFTVFGYDLVPKDQFPMCYISATVKDWRKAFDLEGKTYQQKLDELVGVIECEHFRGNQWSLDQGEAYRKINLTQWIFYEPRARPNTQFATHRVDRDDFYWRDRISSELVDAHLWRPGYEPNNFNNILELLLTMYPFEDFTWLVEYTKKYNELL